MEADQHPTSTRANCQWSFQLGRDERCTTLEQHASLHALSKQIAEGNLKTTLMGRVPALTLMIDLKHHLATFLHRGNTVRPCTHQSSSMANLLKLRPLPEALGNCDENKVQPSEAPEECQLVPRAVGVFSIRHQANNKWR